jgi:hypothetical protein
MKQACAVMVGLMVVLCSLLGQAQQSVAANATVPPLIQFSNVATDEGGSTLSGVVSIAFSLYNSQEGGEPLWSETQNNIQLDPTGHYSVQLGITKPNGVPSTLFTTGEARWLGVQIAGQAEQARVLLLSVPYALKAGDAATIGGLPPSAFVLAAPQNGTALAVADSAAAQSAPPAGGTITGTGTVNFLPLWESTSDIISSVLFQSGTGSTARIGVNTATPAATLDVKGSGTIRGTLSLPPAGTSTAAKGANSQPLNLVASAFNSTSGTAVNQTFQWQAEPTGNDTAAPSGTLNLLFGEGATKPSETGLSITSNGLITFATGQTFPGTGDGSVTSVASGAGLTGGPITGSGTLSIATGGVSNTMLANPSLTVTAGTALTGGGSVALGGTTTLNVDTTKVPQLSASNTFTGNQTINGTITATSSAKAIVGTTSGNAASSNGVFGTATATTGFAVGVYGASSSSGGFGVYGTSSNGVGVEGSSTTGPGVEGYSQAGVAGLFSGSPSSTALIEGQNNGVTEFTVDHGGNVTATGNLSAGGAVTASSFQIGSSPFAFGSYANENALLGFAGNSTMTGFSNTGLGVTALSSNTTGVANTAVGSSEASLGGTAAPLSSNSTGSFNTAVGAGALGSNNSGNYNTAVGEGALGNSTGNDNVAYGDETLYLNTSGASNTGIGDIAGNTSDGSGLTGNNNTALGASASFSTGTLNNATAIGAGAQVSASNAMVLGGINGVNGQTVSTNVGIGTDKPQASLDVAGNNIQTLIGDPGCGTGYAGIGFVVSGGFNTCKNYALLGDNPGNVYINSSLSGNIYFRNNNGSNLMTIDTSGDVSIKGNLSKGGGSFKIDHPLDPANKYLYHSFVESPDMMDVYNGLAKLDANGAVWITLPTYFEALNRDFRYQLTSIGRPQPSLYIAREISGNRFRISGGKPGGKVSWQVTGIRHDAYADANRIQVEVEKPPQEQGHYLHPELFGATAEQAIGVRVPSATVPIVSSTAAGLVAAR